MEYKSQAEPVFIGGLYKSGTSLLRAMLGQHSNIAGGLETYWFDLAFADRFDKGLPNRNVDGTRNEPLREHVKRLAEFYDFDAQWVSRLSEKHSSAEEFIDVFMAEYTKRHAKRRWVEKTPANVLYIDRIYRCWPNGRFIHVVRDPRDVYSSVCRSGKWSEPQEFASLWKKFIEAFDCGRKRVPSSYILEVRYENLVLDPVNTMHSILNFISEPWEEKIASFTGNSADHDKVSKITGKNSLTLQQLRNPLHKQRVGAWVTELNDARNVYSVEAEVQRLGMSNRWNELRHSDNL